MPGEHSIALRVIQPALWAGQQKGGPESPMVCVACPDWKSCAAEDRCARASDEDYARMNPQDPELERMVAAVQKEAERLREEAQKRQDAVRAAVRARLPLAPERCPNCGAELDRWEDEGGR